MYRLLPTLLGLLSAETSAQPSAVGFVPIDVPVPARQFLLPEGCSQLGPPPCDTFVVRPASPPGHFKGRRFKARPHTLLYLNFEGAHLEAGDDDPVAGTSTVLQLQGIAQADFPPFDTSGYSLPGRLSTRQDAIRAVAGWVAEKFGPFDVRVVTTKPPDNVPYTMAVIGGSRGELQLEEGTLGVAPMDCDDAQPNNVIFAFAEEVHDLKELAMVVVHEAGHAMGLAHVDQEDAIMFPYSSRDVDWGAGNVPDGLACDGTSYQASFEVLTTNLGPRPNPGDPWIEFVWPGPQAVVLSLRPVLVQTADDVVVSQVSYSLDGSPLEDRLWPDFSLDLSGLDPGTHELTAVALDAPDNTGNQRAIQVTVTFTYQPDCNRSGTCTDGLKPVGSPCSDGAECETGLCAEAPSGLAVCVRPCSETEPCPLPVGLSDTDVLDTVCTCSDETFCCVPSPEDCGNGQDDDCDGLIDCADEEDCDGNRACTGMEVCDNTIDDDFDGLTNCDDPDCRADPACGCRADAEDCGNGQDDDCDGLVDCADIQDCHTDPACRNGMPAPKLYCAADEGPITFLGSSPTDQDAAGSKRLQGCRAAGRLPPLWWILAGLVLLFRRRRQLPRDLIR